MIDNRLYTFLKLCDTMHYRKTAEALHMTQPAVTQHVHFLEHSYGCKLFTYNGRTLEKTPQGAALEQYSRALLYNDQLFRKELHTPPLCSLTVGVTKTIGDYVIADKILQLLRRDDIQLKLDIDNTEQLLAKLNALELDLLLIEGFVDKNVYDYKPLRQEELVGICAVNHPFANKTLPLDAIFDEPLLLREMGSGTRAVFELFLQQHGHSVKSFQRTSEISSFPLITRAVAENCGISFVYTSVFQQSSQIACFRLVDGPIFHEFNYVFLKGAHVQHALALFE